MFYPERPFSSGTTGRHLTLRGAQGREVDKGSGNGTSPNRPRQVGVGTPGPSSLKWGRTSVRPLTHTDDQTFSTSRPGPDAPDPDPRVTPTPGSVGSDPMTPWDHTYGVTRPDHKGARYTVGPPRSRTHSTLADHATHRGRGTNAPRETTSGVGKSPRRPSLTNPKWSFETQVWPTLTPGTCVRR